VLSLPMDLGNGFSRVECSLLLGSELLGSEEICVLVFEGDAALELDL
jgi:hypothetical protein